MSTAIAKNPNSWWGDKSVSRRLLCGLAVILFIVSWRLIVIGSRYRLHKLAEQVGSVKVIAKPFAPDNSGNHLLFSQSTETGMGVYFSHLQQGGKELLYEVTETRILSGSLTLLEWAPDDSLLAFARPIKGKKQEIVLCSGSVGKVIKKIEVAGVISEFRWLSRHSFAYINEKQELHVVSRDQHGNWKETKHFERLSDQAIQNLTSLSDHTLAWKEGNQIRTLNLGERSADLLWDYGDNILVDFSFSKDNGKILTCVKTTDNSYKLFTIRPQRPETNEVKTIVGKEISKVRWINSGRDYALLCVESGKNSISFSYDEADSQSNPFSSGDVSDFKAVLDRIYVLGSTNQEPPSVWEYNTGSAALRCVVASVEKPFTAAKGLIHTSVVLTNGSREIVYHLWRPASARSEHSCPLIIGQTPYAWSPFPYVAVGSGAYFVTINRKEWFQGLETWEEDVLRVLEELKKDTRIDPHSVFLYGRSAETTPICNMIKEKPDSWKGAILLSPSELPTPPCGQLTTMLVDAGKYDFEGIERILKFQTDAAAKDMPVTLRIHEHARHTSWATETQRARVQQLADYLSSH